MRSNNRAADELRPVKCDLDVNAYAEGSCIFELGNTKVHCTATILGDLPRWRREVGKGGWVTAEYRMLPRATQNRMTRENNNLRGRTAEIQRLIARSLRASIDLEGLGYRQIVVDCDVLQADGGTRTASITGGYIALDLACQALVKAGQLKYSPIRQQIAAVSVGIVDGIPMLDLAYDEDSRADVDFNVVMTGSGEIIEVQGTAEGHPFSRIQLNALMDLASSGIEQIVQVQKQLIRKR